MEQRGQNEAAKLNKELVLTTSWDDGQKIDLKLAKMLTKYGIKGTFYINKSYYDPLPLEKQDVVELSREHEIGSHTLNHVNLVDIPIPEASSEIEGSKLYIEELTGHQIKMFCYPYGLYNTEIKKLVKGAGFIGARTTNPGDFAMPEDPYEWQITIHASNGSPRNTFRIWRINRISIRALIDWEIRAKLLFDSALKQGGVFHLWGHSMEFEKKNEWDKLERVLEYISNKEGVRYITNGDVMGEAR